MRGSPGWQAILIFVVFALTGLPVWRLTQPTPVVAAPAADASASSGHDREASQTLAIEAIFAPPPHDFQIKCLGQTVLEGHGPGSSFKTRWSTAMPAEGVDLVLQARWNELTTAAASDGTPPAVGPCAVRLTVHLADGRTLDKSFWAATDGSLAEVFTVPGVSPAP